MNLSSIIAQLHYLKCRIVNLTKRVKRIEEDCCNGGGGGGIQSIQEGQGIQVDNEDPNNPILSIIESDPTVPQYVKNIQSSQILNWDTAYGWGNHALAGYITSESDPTVPTHVKNITQTNIDNWNTAFGWGDHALAGYLTTETDPTVPAYVKQITQANIDNWSTAYGWGDHSLAGYIKTETDPTVPSHVKSITQTNINEWNTAFGWGDHALAGYLTSETDPTVPTHVKQITATQIQNWNTAYENSITSFTTSGNSGASTFNQGALNIPNYTLQGLGGVPNSRKITINGDEQTLSSDVEFNIETKTATKNGEIAFQGDGTIESPLEAEIAEKVYYKSIHTLSTEPTIEQLNAYGTDRVDCPNVDRGRIYFLNGATWTYVETIQVVE